MCGWIAQQVRRGGTLHEHMVGKRRRRFLKDRCDALSRALHADFGVWINQVKRWFAELTRKRLRRGVHTSVRHLQAAIRAFIDRYNQNPTPFNGPSPPIKC